MHLARHVLDQHPGVAELVHRHQHRRQQPLERHQGAQRDVTVHHLQRPHRHHHRQCHHLHHGGDGRKHLTHQAEPGGGHRQPLPLGRPRHEVLVLRGGRLDALGRLDAGNGDGVEVHRGVEHRVLVGSASAEHLPDHNRVHHQDHQRDRSEERVEHHHGPEVKHHRHHVEGRTGCQHPGDEPGALVHRRPHGQRPRPH